MTWSHILVVRTSEAVFKDFILLHFYMKHCIKKTTRFSKNMCGLEIFFPQLKSGTNREFLAQKVKKWCLKENNPRNGC